MTLHVEWDVKPLLYHTIPWLMFINVRALCVFIRNYSRQLTSDRLKFVTYKTPSLGYSRLSNSHLLPPDVADYSVKKFSVLSSLLNSLHYC